MNRIKEVLEEKDKTQTWLAEKLGKSYNPTHMLCVPVTEIEGAER
jgi:hypothetical protein